MTQPSPIKSLRHLAALQFQVAQAEMAELLKQQLELKENLAQLVQQRTARVQSTQNDSDPALIAGADIRWHAWVDQRRAVINAELAKNRVQIDQCQSKLKVAFGRDQAAQALVDRTQAASKQRQKRRDIYES